MILLIEICIDPVKLRRKKCKSLILQENGNKYLHFIMIKCKLCLKLNYVIYSFIFGAIFL